MAEYLLVNANNRLQRPRPVLWFGSRIELRSDMLAELGRIPFEAIYIDGSTNHPRADELASVPHVAHSHVVVIRDGEEAGARHARQTPIFCLGARDD